MTAITIAPRSCHEQVWIFATYCFRYFFHSLDGFVAVDRLCRVRRCRERLHLNGLAVLAQHLHPDPSLVRGILPNGLRYVLKENREPRNRVAAYLNIQAGSLHETDEQRGYAHFLEHMLFNGSTNFKPGELVEYFQSIGMSFGGDINARTSFDETVYHVILPDAGRSQVEKGFTVLADYARGALLLEKEIERERGVILSERRARDRPNTAPMSPAANLPCAGPGCRRGCRSASRRR